MDPVTSRSNEYDNSCVGLISESRPQQLPPSYCFLQPNSQMPMFDDSISRHLQYPHQVIVTKSNPLGAPDSVSLLMNVQNPISDLDYLDALINSPSARSSGFPDPVMSREDGVFRNPVPEGMENAGRGSVESVPTTKSINAARRNRKKRKKAPRRAATAVMMTDTTNFRAMVQEFTGIPATSSLVPSHLHRAGIGLLGPGISGVGSKLEPWLTYGGLLGPLVPKTKSATSSDHPLISPKLALPFDLGLLNFQPLVQVQDPAGSMQSRSQVGSEENSILGEKEVGLRTH